jgi:hypothetical protein
MIGIVGPEPDRLPGAVASEFKGGTSLLDYRPDKKVILKTLHVSLSRRITLQPGLRNGRPAARQDEDKRQNPGRHEC